MAAAWKAQAKPPVHQCNEPFLNKNKTKQKKLQTNKPPKKSLIILFTSCMTEQSLPAKIILY